MSFPSIIRRVFASDKIYSDAWWNIVAAITSRGVNVCLSILLVHLLSAQKYANYNIAVNAVVTLATVATLGLGTSAMKLIAETRLNEIRRLRGLVHALIGTTVIIALIIGISMIIMSKYLAVFLFHSQIYQGLVVVLSILLLINAILGVQVGVLGGMRAYKQSAVIQVYLGAASLFFQVVIAIYGNLEGILLAMLGGNLLTLISYSLIIRKNLPGSISLELPILIKDAIYCFHQCKSFVSLNFLSSLVVFPIHTLVLLVFNHNPVSSPDDVSRFQASLLWMQMAAFLPISIAAVIIPALGGFAQTPSRLRSYVITNLWKILGVNGAATILAIVVSPLIVMMYGRIFFDNHITIVIAFVCAFFIGINSYLGNILIALGKLRATLLSNLSWALCYLLGSMFLLGTYGVNGIFIACALAYMVHCALLSFFLNKEFIKK